MVDDECLDRAVKELRMCFGQARQLPVGGIEEDDEVALFHRQALRHERLARKELQRVGHDVDAVGRHRRLREFTGEQRRQRK